MNLNKIVQSPDKAVLSALRRTRHSSLMKKSSLLLAFASLLCAASLSASPLLRYEFNQSGEAQASSGSAALSLSILDHSGAAKDYISDAPKALGAQTKALNFTSAEVDEGLEPAQANRGAAQASLNNTNAAFLRSGLGSFTVSGWVSNYTTRSGSTGAQRIFSLRAGSTGIVDLFVSNTTLSLDLRGAEGMKRTELTSAITTGENWHFLAISYNADSGVINLYAGPEGGILKSATSTNFIEGELNELHQNANLLAIGNAGNTHDRRFDGYIADVRFYGSELSSTEVSGIYAIPEPGSALLIGAGALLAFFSPWKLRTL